MTQWKNAHKEDPPKEGLYLVEKMDRDSRHTWFAVEEWKCRDAYEKKYSNEFKQSIDVLVKKNNPSFVEEWHNCFVTKWMEIPE